MELFRNTINNMVYIIENRGAAGNRNTSGQSARKSCANHAKAARLSTWANQSQGTMATLTLAEKPKKGLLRGAALNKA